MSKQNKERLIFLSIIFFLSFMLIKKEISFSSDKREFEDKMRVETTKSGKIQYERDMLIMSESELKEKNETLYKELQDQKGQVIYVADVRTVVKTDTFYLNNTLEVYPDNTFGLKWAHDTIFSPNNYRNLQGESKFKIDSAGITPLNTIVNKDEFGIGIITGIKESGKQIEIFVRSDYPGFQVSSMEGAMIDPKKSEVLRSYFKPKKWGLGPQIGMTVTRQGGVAPYVGVGLSYNLIRF